MCRGVLGGPFGSCVDTGVVTQRLLYGLRSRARLASGTTNRSHPGSGWAGAGALGDQFAGSTQAFDYSQNRRVAAA